MFAYCGNNPINHSDPSGNAWVHWGVAVGIVAIAAVAVVVATGGLAAAAFAVASVANGVAVSSTAATVAAGVFVGSAYGLAASAYGAMLESSSVEEFADYGESAVVTTTFGGAVGGVSAYGLSGHSCFAAGTKVKTENGDVPIEQIATEMKVWAWDEETGEVALKEVVETYVNETYELVHVFVNGEEIVTTPGHPFYSPVKGWTDAVNLRAGDVLVLVNGEYVVVEKIQHEILEAPVTVYNFQVEDYHTYYVANAGVLVHNVCKGNWADGGRGSGYNNARHHFEKHGTEVGARTLEEYTKKATNFANTVLSKKVKKAYISGYTENTYRYYFNKKYIDLAFDGVEHLIVSFGLK